jgi:hypothetical protein
MVACAGRAALLAAAGAWGSAALQGPAAALGSMAARVAAGVEVHSDFPVGTVRRELTAMLTVVIIARPVGEAEATKS